MAELNALAMGADTDFLGSGGEMARLIGLKDWSATPLGPIAGWPQSLRTTVSLCLASKFPINIVWEPQHTQIYNDGYMVLCGEGHPAFLGMDYTLSWASAWPAIGEPFARALAGDASFVENQRMFLHRNGYLEETFFTFCTSPIRNETGGIGGLFHPATDMTATMLGERRTRAVRDLTARLREARTAAEVFEFTAAILANFAFDVPFLLLYRLEQADGSSPCYRLAASTGLAAGAAASPDALEADATAPWPLADIIRSRAPALVRGLAGLLGSTPCGPYEEAPGMALATPVSLPGSDLPVAVMVAGISPRLPLDDAYRGFLDLVAAALGAALANAQAHAEERRRAEALAAIDRAKTVFFSNVSHEFRTPLTLILGPVEDALADADGLAPAQRERLEVAHRNALRLLRLVNTLLDFSRIEAGRTDARFEPVDLAALTAELASNFRSACERAGLDLLVDCPPLDAPVHVDRDMWEKIVLNLVSNAFKFTLQGSIAISLRAAGEDVALEVRDTGVGIPTDELPLVFERFHRTEVPRGRTHEGTGIGLALVQELVRLHGGTISVDSAPGQGTAFRVTMPRGTSHLAPDRIRLQPDLTPVTRAEAYVAEALRWVPDPTDPDAAAPLSGNRPRIVLADDNADMRGYLAQILEQAGYAVEAVADGTAALAAARREPPDLVLTDVMMPGLDGFALLRALRADPAMENILVILLSARAGEEARVDGLAAGADDYLVKPFGARELWVRVDSAVALARLRRDAAAREAELRAQIAAGHARDALHESEQRLEFAMTAGRLGAWEYDFATRRITASAICRADMGCAAADPFDTYDDIMRRIHPDDRARHEAAARRAVRAQSTFDVEHRVLHADGAIGWIEVRGHAVYGPDGTPLRMTGVSLDVTTRKRAEARQELLLKELNHRVKNTLVTVQSIAMQTLRNAQTPAVFSENLTARIAALARAHDLLTRASWDGALLGDVVGETVAQHGTDAGGRRITAEGPPVWLGPNAAVTLNMAFHELAANAARYGALAVPGGRVSVVWNVEQAAGAASIAITWRETHGPEVTPPTHRGFGTRLIEHGLTRELDGEVHLDFAPAGVCCHMRLPVSAKIALVA